MLPETQEDSFSWSIPDVLRLDEGQAHTVVHSHFTR